MAADSSETPATMTPDDVGYRLQGIEMPGAYRDYYTRLSKETARVHEWASAAKKGSKADSNDVIGPKIAFDLADRVSKMHEIEIAEPLRELLAGNGKELSALLLSRDIALGKYHKGDAPLEERIDLAVRVGLAVVTEGVTMAPLEGISAVSIKKNRDGTSYLSVSIAGPMRAAGGTESAVTMLIADHVRKAVGLDRYQAESYDDEPGRFVEELRVYERDGLGFQYHVHDEDIEHTIRNLPVELDGVDTDDFEVVNHRNMARIKTEKVRGGALRVLNDGLIGRSKKLLKRIELYKLDGWEWLAELKGAVQSGDGDAGGSNSDNAYDDKEDASSKRMREVLTGRSVLSMPGRPGGFRLRYGRACNTGFAAVGFHPVIAEILEHTIAVGTQVKTDMPGKGASVAFVDSIETPTVLLTDGSVVKIRDTEHGIMIKKQIAEILHLGDVLISFGDFIENNAKLEPSGYVEEIWTEELRGLLQREQEQQQAPGSGKKMRRLEEFLLRDPTVDEAISLSLEFGLALHPKYLHFWDELRPAELGALSEPDAASESEITYGNAYSDGIVKKALEKAGVQHEFVAAADATADDCHEKDGPADNGNDASPAAKNGDFEFVPAPRPPPVLGTILLRGAEAKILYNLLLKRPPRLDADADATTLGILSDSGIAVRKKSSACIGIRIGRPEKAAARAMSPPTHLLFPVGEGGGPTRDVIKASRASDRFYADLCNRRCPDCGAVTLGLVCPDCGARSVETRRCARCGTSTDLEECDQCGRRTVLYANLEFPLRAQLLKAQERMELRAQEPLKGVKGLAGTDKLAEPIEKGLLRQGFGLTVFKDGTVRFDATNSPLTHFKPSWIGTSVQSLRELGYTHDMDGRPLTGPDQLVEMRMQDVIIPYESGRYLLAAAKYVDALLSRFHGAEPYYSAKAVEDMAGHLVIGLAPHTSVGIVGRIIGFAETHVCFATPNWHSAKRRDADGDADSIMLLMDCLLNFSKAFLSGRIGGLMDAPLLVQPLVLPHESQPQAHNLEVTRSFPLGFFESAARREKAGSVGSVEIIKSRLDTERQFYDYHFTHETSTLTTSRSRSAYSVLGSMLNKLDLQLKNAEMIRAVSPDETALNVITTHLLPDMAGNLRAYARQEFRCTECGTRFRRIPLTRKCAQCGIKLTPNITRPSVEKYLMLTKSLAKKYDIGSYNRGRIALLADEISMVFGKSKGDQLMLSDYM